MNTILFRVWDAEKKVWLDIPSIRGDGSFMPFNCGYEPIGERYKIQQLTGLKDKNKKNIYVGDIIERDYFDGKERTRVKKVMIFADGAFGFEGVIVECVRQCQFDCDYHNFVVVGNIFENPELLKK